MTMHNPHLYPDPDPGGQLELTQGRQGGEKGQSHK